jgi:hypothetical protein
MELDDYVKGPGQSPPAGPNEMSNCPLLLFFFIIFTFTHMYIHVWATSHPFLNSPFRMWDIDLTLKP